MAITASTLDAQAALEAQNDELTTAQKTALVAAWVLAWQESSDGLTDVLVDIMGDKRRVTRGQLLRSRKLRAALVVIRDRLVKLAANAQETIIADVAQVVDTSAQGQDDLIVDQLPADFSLPATAGPERTALDAITERVTQQITSLTDPLGPEAYAAVRAELVRGVVVGDNPRRAARRMVQRAQGRFNGGLYRALNISRTELLDAEREAAASRQAAQADVLVGWVWLSHLGPRTCASCLAKHGTVYSLDTPGPEDHQSGRCTRMPKTKSWADIGVEGMDEPEDELPDAEEWFNSQSAEVQKKIMGPAMLALYQSGAVALKDLTVKKKSSNWRDSWRPPSVQDVT